MPKTNYTEEIRWENRYTLDGIKFDKQGRFARIANYKNLRIGWINGITYKEDTPNILSAKSGDKVYVGKLHFPTKYESDQTYISKDLKKVEMFIEVAWYRFMKEL